MNTNPVDRFLTAITTATIPTADAWAPDAVVDATVPHWRMHLTGSAQIANTFAGWYADPGAFEELVRVPLPDGELVRFLLTWVERGVPHAAHQTHAIRVHGGRIVAHTVFCGGRWPAGLLAEMAEASGA